MNRLAALGLWLAATLVLLSSAGFAADATNSPVAGEKAVETNSLELMRSYVQLQEQLHQAQLSIEQTRKEARESALATAEALSAQLKSIEMALAAQRARELEAMQSANRVMLIMAGAFATLGFAAMILMAYFQWRTVHGLAEISAALPPARSLVALPAAAALGQGDMQPSAVAEISVGRLLGALEQLEKRILGLERAQQPALEAGSAGPGSGHNGNGDSVTRDGAAEPSQGSFPGPGLSALLARGQALLDQDDPSAALAEFEQVLAANPGHAEALVKKGSALERLGQLTEAVECYDQAIAADGSLTVAYLHKGGLFNRMEKFSEALDCYEKALRTQEKRG